VLRLTSAAPWGGCRSPPPPFSTPLPSLPHLSPPHAIASRHCSDEPIDRHTVRVSNIPCSAHYQREILLLAAQFGSIHESVWYSVPDVLRSPPPSALPVAALRMHIPMLPFPRRCSCIFGATNSGGTTSCHITFGDLQEAKAAATGLRAIEWEKKVRSLLPSLTFARAFTQDRKSVV
jgi:hypothetical protein